MIVLDASVVLKWIFDDEDGGEQATRLKDAHVAGHEIVAVPDLLFYEIGNVLGDEDAAFRSGHCRGIFAFVGFLPRTV